jgi:hypothetical protein
MPFRFLGLGGSLLVTGFVVSRPHLIARENALERTPAMLRTVFLLSGRSIWARALPLQHD